jgi:hypothetical protein
MNLRACIIALGLVSVERAHALDWEAIKKSPAEIQVANMQATPLVAGTEKKGWLKVPTQFTQYKAVVYVPSADTNGVADITVTGDGYLILACNYDYQGNQSGDWKKDVWDERKFKSKGWNVLGKTEIEGQLINGENRTQVLFLKKVKKGEVLKLRCNKYNPPYPILVPSH